MDRNYILTECQSAGYPDAGFVFHATPLPASHEVSVEYTITLGNPQFVRELLITGMRTTRMRLIQPAVGIQAGDPLSWTSMSDMQRKLYDFGVFDTVDVAIQDPDGTPTQICHLSTLTKARPLFPGGGAGAELGRFGGCQPIVLRPCRRHGLFPAPLVRTITRNNLWGLGHSMSLARRFSTLDQRASLNYSWPEIRNNEGRIFRSPAFDNTRKTFDFTITPV